MTYQPLLGMFPQRTVNKYLYASIPWRVIHNNWKVEMTQVSLSRSMDKQNVAYACKGKLLRLKKNICYNTVEPWKHAEWKWTNVVRLHLYKISRVDKFIATESSLEATRNWKGGRGIEQLLFLWDDGNVLQIVVMMVPLVVNVTDIGSVINATELCILRWWTWQVLCYMCFTTTEIILKIFFAVKKQTKSFDQGVLCQWSFGKYLCIMITQPMWPFLEEPDLFIRLPSFSAIRHRDNSTKWSKLLILISPGSQKQAV